MKTVVIRIEGECELVMMIMIIINNNNDEK